MKKILRLLSRLLLVLPALVLQVLWWLLIFRWWNTYYNYLIAFSYVFSILVIIYIINRREESNYKILWIIVVSLLPFFGTWLYVSSGNRRTSKPILRKINNYKYLSNKPKSKQLPNDSRVSQTMNMISSLSNAPIVKNKDAVYFKSGESMFKDMLKELETAKHFIYLEYFIVEKGQFWNSILDILKRKVKEGVDVRILYDDIGSISTFSLHNNYFLKKDGIHIASFNPIKFIKLSLNNRDHRKMMIIDNRIVYSGGINIADEYINTKVRFGYWKDIGFKLKGEATLSYTHMFVLFWNAYSSNKIDEHALYKDNYPSYETNEHVISYYDSPGNEEAISNKLMIDLLGQATKYAYFYTPYLILNDPLKEAFIQAAQRGIDVQIIIPGIPDKKLVYLLTKKYAEELVDKGVKVYVYKDGFIHAKAALIDDKICSIGSVNLDYRSLYLHFENNTVFYESSILKPLKEDFLNIRSQSNIMPKKDKKDNVIKRILISIIDLISPLC